MPLWQLDIPTPLAAYAISVIVPFQYAKFADPLGWASAKKIKIIKEEEEERISACQTFARQRQIKCLTQNVCTLFAVILLFDLSFMIAIESVHALDV